MRIILGAPVLFLAFIEDDDWYVILAMLFLSLLIGGLALFIHGFRTFRLFRQIENIPFEPIRSIPMGLVHVRGKATGGDCLTSPLTRMPCYVYTLQVRGGEERPVTHSRTFYLDDGTGRVLVDPSGASLRLPKTLEATIESGVIKKLYIASKLGAQAPTRQKVLAYMGTESRKLGWITESCLIAGREHNILGTCSENPEPKDEHDRHLICKGESETDFFITSEGEKQAEAGLHFRGPRAVVLGAIFMIVAVAIALAHLGLFSSAPRDTGPSPPSSSPRSSAPAPLREAMKVTRLEVDSQTQAAKLIFQVKPEYPRLAKQARIQGTVRLEAVISKNGAVENLRVISGHPLLAKSALETVSRWRYQPTISNGAPVAVVTQIDVNFTLGK